MSETQGRCPQDGGFLGDAGCTHPYHKHSELVENLLRSNPRRIEAEEADALLNEGFYVDSREHRRVGFGKSLLHHINEHGAKDAEERKKNLLYAIDTVRNTEPTTHNERGFEGRVKWVNRSYSDKIIMVISTPDTKAKKEAALDIDYVFTMRKESK